MEPFTERKQRLIKEYIKLECFKVNKKTPYFEIGKEISLLYRFT
jgi:hypothetical protein